MRIMNGRLLYQIEPRAVVVLFAISIGLPKETVFRMLIQYFLRSGIL